MLTMRVGGAQFSPETGLQRARGPRANAPTNQLSSSIPALEETKVSKPGISRHA